MATLIYAHKYLEADARTMQGVKDVFDEAVRVVINPPPKAIKKKSSGLLSFLKSAPSSSVKEPTPEAILAKAKAEAEAKAKAEVEANAQVEVEANAKAEATLAKAKAEAKANAKTEAEAEAKAEAEAEGLHAGGEGSRCFRHASLSDCVFRSPGLE